MPSPPQSTVLPNTHSPLVDITRIVTPVWGNFFQSLYSRVVSGLPLTINGVAKSGVTSLAITTGAAANSASLTNGVLTIHLQS